jgi:hypothetical protein
MTNANKTRSAAWADGIAMLFLAFASPLIAACIQSLYVFWSDHWIYQALIGGAYFHTVEKPGVATMLFIFVYCGVLAIPTLAWLLVLRKRTIARWVGWIGSTALWTWFYFDLGSSYVIK